MKFKKLNVNHHVYAKLTEKGIKLWEDFYAIDDPSVTVYLKGKTKLTKENKNSDGYHKFQMHEFMAIFGDGQYEDLYDLDILFDVEQLEHCKLRNEPKELNEFRALSDREKWVKFKEMPEDTKWACGNCGEEMEGEKPEMQFMSSLHCDNCDHELTRRTGGGQNDPFRWIPILTKSE